MTLVQADKLLGKHLHVRKLSVIPLKSADPKSAFQGMKSWCKLKYMELELSALWKEDYRAFINARIITSY